MARLECVVRAVVGLAIIALLAPVAAQERSNRELAAIGLQMTHTLASTECATPQGPDPSGLFRDFGLRQPRGAPRTRTSAIALDTEGHLISVAIEGTCTRYRATRHDGTEFVAELVAWDEESSVGLLRGEPTAQIPAFGDPQALRPGDPVWVFGTAYDMPGTIGHGVVSTTRRYLANQFESHYLQTDAPTHQGQSGGPVLDASGKVVGLNAYILARGGRSSFDGLAFALPIDVARRIAADLIEYGEYRPARLGVDIEPDGEGKGSLPGVLVTDVGTSGPSHNLLRRGDRILTLGGRPLQSAQDLQVSVRLSRPGQTLRFAVQRGEDLLQVAVVAGSAE